MIAIKANESGDVIFFDVVTQYSRGFQSQVTKHPVDGAGTISDHVVKQNPTMTIRGVISSADFNNSKPQDLIDSDKETLGVNRVVVDGSVAEVVNIQSEDGVANFLPGVAGQFVPETRPKITGWTFGRGDEDDIVSLLETYRDEKQAINVYEFDNVFGRLQITRDFPEDNSERIYITGLNIDESADKGDARTFTMTFETVTASTLETTVAPENTSPEVQEQTADMENKGGVNSNAVDVEEGSGREPTFLQSLLGG